MELRDILNTLWKMRRMILTLFGIVFLVVMGCVLLVTPWYVAGAKVLMSEPRMAALLLDELEFDYASGSTIADADIANEVALATSRDVAQKVIDELGLTRKRIRYQLVDMIPFSKILTRPLGMDGEATRKRLSARELVGSSPLTRIFPRPGVQVEQFQDTEMLEITAKSTDLQEAVDIANCMARQMIATELGRTSQAFAAAREFVDKALESARTDQVEARRAADAFISDTRSLDVETESSTLVEKILDLREEIQNNEAAITQSTVRIEELKTRIAALPMYRKSGEGWSNNDLAQTLKSSLQAYELDLAEARADFTDEHPETIAIRDKIAKVTAMLKETEARVLGAETIGVHPIYEMLEEDLASEHLSLAAYLETRDRLPKTLARYEALVPAVAERTSRSAELSRHVAVTEDAYAVLLKTRHQMGIAAALSASRLSIVEPALTPPPGERSKTKQPSVVLGLIAAVLLGTFLSLGTALVVAYTANALKSSDDLRAFPDLRVLGAVPTLTSRRARAIGTARASPLPETIRSIRRNIDLVAEEQGHKSLVVTSASLAEGKSLLAAGIAASAAAGAKRVLLVDANRIRPSVHRRFARPPAPGLCELLHGETQAAEAARPVDLPGLTVVTLGDSAAGLDTVLESGRMEELIRTWEAEYDLVVIDAPSCSDSCDAAILGSYAGGAVLVAQDNKTGRDEFGRTLSGLREAGVRVIGAVLNKVSSLPSPFWRSQL